MNRKIQLPVDLMIKQSTNDLVETNAWAMGLKQYRNGYSPIGENRIGLLPFNGENISFNEIEEYINEKDTVGSSVWKHFIQDLKNIPESWDYNLYFSTFFSPINPKDPKTKFIVCLTKGSGNIFKPVLKPIGAYFIPKENDRLVCVIYK